MPYVQRNDAGQIIGIFANRQPGYAEEWVDGEVEVYQPAPTSVSPLQARRALRQAGLSDAVAQWIATQDADTQDAWEYAVEVLRTDPAIAGAAGALGMTEAQIDDLFRLAATL